MRIQLHHLLIFFIITILLFSCKTSTKESYKNWYVYGGTKDAMHYSSLTEVDSSNVGQLQVAWEYHTGDADTGSSTQIQCNPIIVNGVLYALTPKMKLFALDAATGQENWVFNPEVLNRIDTNAPAKLPLTFLNTGRGVSYWTDGKNDRRIFYTAGYYLICLNATTGKIITTFGDNGHIDLHDGLGRDVKDRFITSNTPGVIYKDLLIMGSRVAEDATAAPGHIRAYNVITGKQQSVSYTHLRAHETDSY